MENTIEPEPQTNCYKGECYNTFLIIPFIKNIYLIK